MEEDQEIVARLQRDAADDVILQNYSYLVGCVNAVLIFPYLVQSGLVNQDFRQYLEAERTDKDRMMTLLRELTKNPMDSWFKEFIGALSKISQYNPVVDNLLKDFTDSMKTKQSLPPPAEDDRRKTLLANTVSEPVSPMVINVSGVDEVIKKAMDDAQAGHMAALSELKKASSHLLEAEKAKAHAEAGKMILEERVNEFRKNLSKANERLKDAEMQQRLFEKEIQSYKEEASETQQRVYVEKMQLKEDIKRLQSEEKAARERLQDVKGEKEALGTRVAELQAEVNSNVRERKEEVRALREQLDDAKTQQQMVEDEMKRLWKDMKEKQQRLESATRQLDEVQSTREKEISHLQGQLEKSTSRIEALKKELADAKAVNASLAEDLSVLRKELENKSVEFVEVTVVQQKAEEMKKIVHEQKEFIHELEIDKERLSIEATALRVQLDEAKESIVVMSTSQKDVERLTKQLESSMSHEAHLAAQLEDLSSTQELAVQELTQRKEEGEEKDVRIAELEEALQRAVKEHRKTKAEIMVIEEREVELTRKLELGKELYTKKATEANDLSRQLRKVQESTVVVSSGREEVEELTKQLTASQSRETRLAAQLEDLSSMQELAVQELTQRKEEGEEKDVLIAELEEALQRAVEEHRKTKAEIMVIEERTDRKIHDKNGEIILLEDRIAELEEDMEQERREVVNLREALRLRQECLDVQQWKQQRQRVPQYRVAYQPPQDSAPYIQPYAPPPIRYPAQGYPHNQGPAPTPRQPSASPAHVPAPVPPPGPNEGQCPVCHLNFPKNSLEQHVNGHFEN